MFISRFASKNVDLFIETRTSTAGSVSTQYIVA